MNDQRSTHRSIVERIEITGNLILDTPAHFGNGEIDALTDMPLFFDEASGRPLLPGTSIAGALRSYLREVEFGFSQKEAKNSWASKIFGGIRTDDEGAQSPLIVDDALGISQGIELRDGVAIDPETRTAEDHKKFDFQLLAAGSSFDLHFELIISEGQDPKELRRYLHFALQGLEKGEITLGARKHRGFGQCHVENWQIREYNLKSKQQFCDWLESDRLREIDEKLTIWAETPIMEPEISLTVLLDEKTDSESIIDNRKIAHLNAKFKIDGTLLIRSGFGESDKGPDTVHLHSKRDQTKTPVAVISGTSLTGVIRQRASKICRTISDDKPVFDSAGEVILKNDGNPLRQADIFVDNMFGQSEIKPGEKDIHSSRITIKETEIQNPNSMVITRVKIDRFSGGALNGALFT